MAGVIPNPELPSDHLGHPREGPEIRGVARPARALRQDPLQRVLLRRGQPRRSPRGRPGLQAARPGALIRLPPPPHRTHRRLHLPRDAGHRPARLQEPYGPSTAPLQLLRRTRGAHRTTKPTIFPLFLQPMFSEKPGSITRNLRPISCRILGPGLWPRVPKALAVAALNKPLH